MRKRGGEISSPLAYEEVDAIATIVELVREVVEPVIEAPFVTRGYRVRKDWQ